MSEILVFAGIVETSVAILATLEPDMRLLRIHHPHQVAATDADGALDAVDLVAVFAYMRVADIDFIGMILQQFVRTHVEPQAFAARAAMRVGFG